MGRPSAGKATDGNCLRRDRRPRRPPSGRGPGLARTAAPAAPDRVLIAASTDSPREFLRSAIANAPGIHVEVARFAGGVVDARAGAQLVISEEFTAFLDSDETAPPEWLERLIAPLEAGTAEFSGGPTRPSRPPRTSVERYMELLERSIYEDLVPSRVTYLPLQNTAWRSAPLARLGFDPRIPFAEDHDVESRAERAGLRGVFLPEAWVFHDPGASSETAPVGSKAVPVPAGHGDVAPEERAARSATRRASSEGAPPPPSARGCHEAVRARARSSPLEPREGGPVRDPRPGRNRPRSSLGVLEGAPPPSRANLKRAPGSAGPCRPRPRNTTGEPRPGHLVRLEYDLWAEGGGRTDLIDTTHEEVAQAANVPEQARERPGDPGPTSSAESTSRPGMETALVGLKHRRGGREGVRPRRRLRRARPEPHRTVLDA